LTGENQQADMENVAHFHHSFRIGSEGMDQRNAWNGSQRELVEILAAATMVFIVAFGNIFHGCSKSLH